VVALAGAAATHALLRAMAGTETRPARVPDSAATQEGSPAGARSAPREAGGGAPLPFDVHAFYYAWYGSPPVDGKYSHWNHVRMPHWNAETAAKHRRDAHEPPDDVAGTHTVRLPQQLAGTGSDADLRGVGALGVCSRVLPCPGRVFVT
jgi:hypothetical protein